MSAARRTKSQKAQAQLKHQAGLTYSLASHQVGAATKAQPNVSSPAKSSAPKIVSTDPGLILRDLLKTGWVTGVILVLLLGLGMWLR